MVFAPGKVILAGEHGVVFGTSAIAAAVGRGVRAEAFASPVATLAIDPWNVEVTPGDRDRQDAKAALAEAFSAILEAYGEPPRTRVQVRVEISAGAGLGCSAAIGVAIVRAIDSHLGLTRDSVETADRALLWERTFHGNPSGVDTAISAAGGIGIFKRGHPIAPLHPKQPFFLVIGNSGAPSETKAMVESVARQYAHAKARVQSTFDAMESLVGNARVAIETGDPITLGKLLDLNHALLSSLMLSTERLEAMCEAARKAGSMGAKITGAGGGGCMLALAPDETGAARIAEAIASLGREAFVTRVGHM